MSDDTWLQCQQVKQIPSGDIGVLLAMRLVTRVVLGSLPKLVLIQTLTDGYDVVDIGAAAEMGVWTSYSL